MFFSKACEYGIRAAIYIASASQETGRVGLKDIANKIDSPEAFTAKILQILVRSGVVASVKGVNGGFSIEPERLEEIRLMDIVRAIDGNELFVRCAIGLKECSAKHPCPAHHEFKRVRDELQHMLTTTALKDLTPDLALGMAFLKH